MTVIREINIDSFYDLYDMCWSGAIPVLDEIREQERDDEAMQIIEEAFLDENPTDTQVNDFIWFDLAEIMNLYDE